MTFLRSYGITSVGSQLFMELNHEVVNKLETTEVYVARQ